MPRRPGWRRTFWRVVTNLRTWLDSADGGLLSRRAAGASKLYIAAWWAGFLALAHAMTSTSFTLTFVVLWFLSRATTFHLITTFREMCDHYGLKPGGIMSFTRDTVAGGLLRWFIHPRNNGLHLSHHLMPAVPYYRLPKAQRLFREVPTYRAQAHVCSTYFARSGVVQAWRGSAA